MPILGLWFFSVPWPDLTTPVLCSPEDFSIGFACGDKIVSLIWGFFPLCETEHLFGCHGKTGAEWFSVASDFHYLFSIRATYLSKKKLHVEREKVTEQNTASLTGHCVLRICIQTRGPLSLSLARFHTDSVLLQSITTANPARNRE